MQELRSSVESPWLLLLLQDLRFTIECGLLTLKVAPKHEWVDTLSSWYTMQTDESLSQLTPLRRAFNGGDSGVSMNTPSMSLEEGKIAAMQAGAPVYFRVRGTLVMMKHDENQPLYYFACPGESCGKKVSPRDDGTWFCERCNHAYPVMQPRYILSLVVSDYSGRYIPSSNRADFLGPGAMLSMMLENYYLGLRLMD